ncbi:MAG TPA: molybdopterin-dependent oxidoreductase [bacterium]|nr:molybdopterin-dependent oxidoreductase [bacterium]
MKNVDMKMHVKGQSVFIDDIKAPIGLLNAALFTSPVAKGRIKNIDISAAQKSEGVAMVITHKDIPGKNQIGHMIADQPLLAFDEIEYIGQPIAIVVADTRKNAKKACQLIKVDIEKLEPVFEPREAYQKGLIHAQKRVLVNGNIEEAFKKSKYIASGRIDSGGQEHFYFETQRALAIPKEADTIKVCASCQSPGAFQHHIAEVLDIPMHKVELEIRRLGGGFGGKESTAVWVVAAALVAKLLNRLVKLVISRNEDIATTGKRHPYSYDYKIGLDENGKILAFEVFLYQQAGGCADISPAVLGRSFLHTSGSYCIPNVKITAVSCKTNIPPNNAFRGFGVPQGTFIIESALFHASEIMGKNIIELKKINLLKDGDFLPYGMQLKKTNAVRCWETLDEKVNIKKRIEAVEEFNKNNQTKKRGISVIPVCFGISFAQSTLNQASALVNIYIDGSVSVSTGAVEMGQGVNTKILSVAANTLGIQKEKVRVDTTNTSRIPNASPTSASTGADLNGMATKFACEELLTRLKKLIAKKTNFFDLDKIRIKDGIVYLCGAKLDYTWEELILDAYNERTDLSCHSFYATPAIYYDRVKERGRPFAYYSYGTSLTEVEVDILRGVYEIVSIDVVHDVGKSLSPEIDKGQIEGAVIQSIGWTTIEQLRYAPDGKMLSSANSYKIPDIKFVPKNFNVMLLENSENPYAVCNSKAIGEPPFIHGLGAYFAILDVLRKIRKDKPLPSLPLTPEKVFMYIYE